MQRNIWQYLEHSEPVLPTPRVGLEIPWEPELPSLPGRIARLPIAALTIASFVSAPVVEVVVNVEPLNSIQVRSLPRVIDYRTGAENPLEVPESQHVTWYQPLSEPNRSVKYSLKYSTGGERSPEIPVSQHLTWYNGVNEPIVKTRPRVVSFATNAELGLNVPILAAVTLDWYQNTSVPNRVQKLLQYETGATNPLEVPKSQHVNWYQELASPSRTLKRVVDYRTGGEWLRFPPVIAVTNVFRDLDLPRPKKRISTTEITVSEPVIPWAPPPVVDISWYRPLDEQVRKLKGVVDYHIVRPGPELNVSIFSPCSWGHHFQSRGWSNIQAQIDAGYPIYAQPTELTGSYEEIIDYGTILTNTIATIRWSENDIVGDVDVVCKLASSTDGISYSSFFTGTSRFFASIRYLKIRLEFTSNTDLELMQLSDLVTVLDVKREVDAGQVTALASDGLTGTEVLFNKAFKDVDSIELTVAARQPITAIYRFTDVPDPTGFHVLCYDSSGNQVDYLVSWMVRGIV